MRAGEEVQDFEKNKLLDKQIGHYSKQQVDQVDQDLLLVTFICLKVGCHGLPTEIATFQAFIG